MARTVEALRRNPRDGAINLRVLPGDDETAVGVLRDGRGALKEGRIGSNVELAAPSGPVAGVPLSEDAGDMALLPGALPDDDEPAIRRRSDRWRVLRANREAVDRNLGTERIPLRI